MRLKRFATLLALLVLAGVSGKPVTAQTLAESILSAEYSTRDEFVARDDVVTAVEQSLSNGRFAELEKMAEVFRSEKSKMPSGRWKLGFFYSGIDRAYQKAPSKTEAQVAVWVRAYPSSSAAHISNAITLLAEAWRIRGTGYATTVEPQNWKPFNDTVERARQYLLQYESIASDDPHWYAMMADIATIQGWPDPAFDALLLEAFDREPMYDETYIVATNRNLPKWGGSAEKIERFAREAVERTRATDGSGRYARIYWWASKQQYDDDLFESSHVDWAEMSKGIDDVLAQYPSQFNINHFAHFACLAGDYSKALELMERIDFPPMAELWGGPFSYYRCKLWAELVG